MSRQVIDYLVLDSIIDDIESLDHIRTAVARIFPSGYLEALHRLVTDRLVEACILSKETPELEVAGEGVWPEGNTEDLWFRVTPRGRIVQANWKPDAEAGTA
jgi:hypothetical protein